MPSRSLKPCAHPGCGALVRGKAYCEPHQVKADERRAEHMKTVHADYNSRRDSSDSFYKAEAWKKLSAIYKKRHPLCVECEAQGRITPVQIVDHIKSYKTHPQLGLDWSNLRSLCRSCHMRVGERVGLRDDQRAG